MKPDSFWKEPSGQRLKKIIGTVNCAVIVLVNTAYLVSSRSRPEPKTPASHWINYDPARPLTDIGRLDYGRRLIIYRDEEPKRQIRAIEWPADDPADSDPANSYEDDYEELYESFHD